MVSASAEADVGLYPWSRLARRPGQMLVGRACAGESGGHFQVTGVDISEVQLELARRSVPAATFVHADLTEIEFPEASVEGVAALYVISHVPRAEHPHLFARISSWLVPGGLFLATLGAADSPDWRGEWLGVPMFFSSYDAEVNRALLRAAAFDLVFDEVIEHREPEGPVSFLWVIARKRLEA